MRRLAAVVGVVAMILMVTTVASPAEAKRLYGSVSLYSSGTKYANTTFKVKGTISSNTGRSVKKIVLQQRAGGRWVTRSTKYQRANGTFLVAVKLRSVGRIPLRASLYVKGHLLDRSNVITVRTIKRPSGGGGSTPPPTPPPAHPKTSLQGCMNDPSVANCLDTVDAPPANSLLPDIRVRSFAHCPASVTPPYIADVNQCFSIIETDDTYSPDFPELWNKKLLKFPMVTINVGQGPAEIVADRTGDVANWKAYQTFYTSNGDRKTVYTPNADFYFAGDGHNHWHVKDFDSYAIYPGTDTTGTPARTAEKHGYCLEDNLGPLPVADAKPQVTYEHDKMCGLGLPAAVTIIHGLSVGWGDTYPRTLPDQGIDITGLKDGDYTVVAKADYVGAITENAGGEANNTASIKIHIEGDTVTPDLDSARGGWGDAE